MTVTIDHAKTIGALIRNLRSTDEAEPFPARDPLDELVFSFLLWEAPRTKAEPALKRLLVSTADHNELRVTRPEEIAEVLGKTYPLGSERASRLSATLNELYLREYAVTLDRCVELNKREGRKYLETLEGMPPFVASRLTLCCLEGHAIPVDQRLLGKLIEEGVIEEQIDEVSTSGILERHLKAGEGALCHLLLQAWVDGEIAPKTASRARPATKRASKKGTRKSTASRANRRR